MPVDALVYYHKLLKRVSFSKLLRVTVCLWRTQRLLIREW